MLFLVNADYSIVHAGNFIQDNLANFEIINKSLIMIFGLDNSVTNFQSALQINKTVLYSSPGAIMVARFIAFAYTYHYLNWFSKTSLIKWHEISKARMAVILFLWIASVVLYLINYQLGFKLLFLLSIMHVLLEFPLNIVTLKGIGIELKKLIR